MKSHRSRSKPEIIEVSEKALEAIESRILSNSLSEEDKKIVLSIMLAYSWISRQLRSAKLTIHRLKGLFGFSTEKQPRPNKKETRDSLALVQNSLPELKTSDTAEEETGEPDTKKQ